MKKIYTLSAAAAIAACSLFSCSKQSDVKVTESEVGGSTSGFNWSGTAPMSAKLDGQPFQAATAQFAIGGGGMMVCAGHDENTLTLLSFSLPGNATAGKVYTLPYPAAATATIAVSSVLVAKSGKIKVVRNDAGILEGYFWAELYNPQNLSEPVVQLSEGYFKVEK